MKITDEMIEAALITWFKNEVSWDKGMAPWSADQFRVEMRVTLEAALSASPAGVVKPLEWITRENRDSGRLQSIAHTIVGTYALTDCADLGYIELHERAIGKVSKFKTIEAAKSAAFADYSARIMSALEPAGVGVETAIRSAGLKARDELLERRAAAEARAEAAEALLKEAKEVLEPFAHVAERDISEDEFDDDVFRPMPGQYARAQLINVGHLRAARAIHHKIGVKDE